IVALGEREDSLRLMRRAIESAVNGVLICDARMEDFPIVFVNAAFERITGYSESEALGRNPRFLNASDEDDGSFADIRQALVEQREVHAVLRNIRKSGDVFWNDMFIAPVRDDEGEVTHFIGI